MGALIDSASAILTQANERVEVSAQNIANLTTPGYKRRVAFKTVLSDRDQSLGTGSALATSPDLRPGKLIETGVETDLALLGSGLFVVRQGDNILFTRQGQFQRDPEGRLVTTTGAVLQAEGGGDIILGEGQLKVTSDGVLLQDERPVGRIAIAEFENAGVLTFADDGLLKAPEAEPVTGKATQVRQGALEASNVSTADEMVAMMAALRRAEAAQRLVNVYDELMGRALSTFGQSS